MTKQKITPGQMLVEKLVAAIEQGQATGKWIRPWRAGSSNNPVTGRSYSGGNALYLAMYRAFAEVEHTEWYATLKQWNSVGAKVRSGEKGLTLTGYPKAVEKKDADGNVLSSYTHWGSFTVFNSSQVEGWTPPELTTVATEQDVRDRFQAIIDRHGIVVNTGTAAYYMPTTDELTMPPIASFPVEDNYWSVLAHEAIHWTGHPSRLDRIKIGSHTGDAYAFEELVAELGSVFVSAEFGVVPESDANILAYLGSWHRQIKKDKDCVRKAAAAAAAAANFLK
jgi:antirestriction protein ArdC